ncbi:hypothetical protein GCM10018787_33270 [Streptomyces thermodiastaticus]|nr:hypothetical protein GCM10018787_33270 [Streptomyces thermodiastaticus]
MAGADGKASRGFRLDDLLDAREIPFAPCADPAPLWNIAGHGIDHPAPTLPQPGRVPSGPTPPPGTVRAGARTGSTCGIAVSEQGVRRLTAGPVRASDSASA